MIEPAVKLDVPQGRAGDGRNDRHLRGDQGSARRGLDCQFAAAEVGGIGVARVRTNRHPMAACECHRFSHQLEAAGVDTAADVGGGNQRHELRIVRSPLAQIAVEVGGPGRSQRHRLSPGRVRPTRTDAAASRSRSA